MQPSPHHQLLDSVRNYETPGPSIELLNQSPPLIIAGMSSTGKNAIAKKIIEQSNYRRVVTHTTRGPRPGEVSGRDYWFVSEEEFLNLIKDQIFIETQQVHQESFYGTSIEAYKAVIASGYQPLLVVDVYGEAKMIKNVENLRPFFILPPSFEVWMERWEKRGFMSHPEKSRRLHTAKDELQIAINDERFILVVNYEVPQAAKTILDGITDAPTQHRNRELAKTLIDHTSSFSF
jgi:guanylate kinase